MFVAREFARRQVQRGRARYAWLAFGAFIPVYGFLAVSVMANGMNSTTPGLAVVIAVLSSLMLVLNVRAVARVSRMIHLDMSTDERAAVGTALFEPTLILIGVILVGGLLMAVGSLVYVLAVAVSR